MGWIIQTTMFRVFLPIEKCLEWTQDINTLIKKKIVSTKEIESTIGRLNHAGHILPLGRYFLTRLRYRLMMCKKWGRQKLAKWDCEDLELWIIFLENASQKGININNITYTRPTDIGTTDACETGMGGYLEDGRAWRWKIPTNLQGIFTINLLEFLAAVVNIWIVIRSPTKERKILSFTDSSSALGWLHHSTFNPITHPIHDNIARHLAKIFIEADSTLYSQHVAGKQNFIADSLSRDYHISTVTLTKTFVSLFPDQIPSNFRIMTLPKEITSWLYSLKDFSIVKMASPQEHNPSKLGVLLAGVDSYEQLTSTINSLKDGPSQTKSAFSVPLQQAYEEICMGKERNHNWQEAQLVPPSRTYV